MIRVVSAALSVGAEGAVFYCMLSVGESVVSEPTDRASKPCLLRFFYGQRIELSFGRGNDAFVVLLIKWQMIDALTILATDVAFDHRVIFERFCNKLDF